jgi:hypothetical protein
MSAGLAKAPALSLLGHPSKNSQSLECLVLWLPAPFFDASVKKLLSKRSLRDIVRGSN